MRRNERGRESEKKAFKKKVENKEEDMHKTGGGVDERQDDQ